MTKLVHDAVGEHGYETGVSTGVLYPQDTSDGTYPTGVAWNGLTTVTESPGGATANPQYADNIKYLNLRSVETWSGTIEALTYPVEFEACDGSAELTDGVTVGQQPRQPFGFSYKTLLGTDTNPDKGYKIHLVFGCTAAPSQKAHATVNDSPAAEALSWAVDTLPVAVGTLGGHDYKPTATIDVDSTRVDADALAALEAILYGDADNDARLPLPAEVYELFGSVSLTAVDLGVAGNQPAYNGSTHVVTLPAVTGVQWQYNGANVAAGARPALSVGETAHVKAKAADGYTLEGSDDWTFDY